MSTFHDRDGNAVRVPCADTDPEEFFLGEGRPGKRADASAREHAEHLAHLRALCVACPVTQACLKEALRWDDDGFRGGLTAEERRAIRERRGRGKRKGTAYSAALEAALADERAARAARRGAA